MTILKIHDFLTDSKPLRRVAREVRADEFNTDALCQFIQDLAETMIANNGMGLAATQVDAAAPDGSVWALFVARGPSPDVQTVILNPRIHAQSDPRWEVEGCLSFRSVAVRTRQPNKIDGTFVDYDGVQHPMNLTDLAARAVAHETEHLRGKVLVDRMNPRERTRFLTQVAKVRRVT